MGNKGKELWWLSNGWKGSESYEKQCKGGNCKEREGMAKDGREWQRNSRGKEGMLTGRGTMVWKGKGK